MNSRKIKIKNSNSNCDNIKKKFLDKYQDKINKKIETCEDINKINDIDKNIKHNFIIKLGKSKVKKTIQYNHIITANITHYVKENISCIHTYDKDIIHQDINKRIDGDKHCKEQLPNNDKDISIDQDIDLKNSSIYCKDSEYSDFIDTIT